MRKKFYIKFSIVWILISFSVQQMDAQNMEETKKMAAHFFSIQNYEQTESLCHRILCFGDDNDKLDANILLGKTYFETNQFKKSILNFREALGLDPLNEDIFYDYILALINDYQYDVAFTELEARKINDSLRNRYMLYKGICYFLLDEHELSRVTLDSLMDESCPEKKQELDNLLKKIRYKNPTSAQVLSAIIPGSGQMYAGDLKNGSKAFALNASLLTASVYISKEYSIVNAGMATFQWFIRYYISNIKNARKIAFQQNDKKKMNKYQQLISILESGN